MTMAEGSELLQQAAANRDLARMARSTMKGLFRPEDRDRMAQYADELDRRALLLEQEAQQMESEHKAYEGAAKTNAVITSCIGAYAECVEATLKRHASSSEPLGGNE